MLEVTVYLTGLNFSLDNNYANLRSTINFHYTKVFEKVKCINEAGQPYICEYKTETHLAPAATVVNMWYMALQNSFYSPAGVLQGAVFNSDAPYYMNFGALGFIYGHEMTHGFDNRGSHHGYDGKYCFYETADCSVVDGKIVSNNMLMLIELVLFVVCILYNRKMGKLVGQNIKG